MECGSIRIEIVSRIKDNWLRTCKAKAEAYFARQMGMTVPQWREAQAKAIKVTA